MSEGNSACMEFDAGTNKQQQQPQQHLPTHPAVAVAAPSIIAPLDLRSRAIRDAAGWLVDICAGRESIHHNSKVELWVDVAAAAAAGLVSLRRPIRA
ncbi:unnamed protein product [Onchocerca ochengi]|uniref:Uncharacterized protein n=1 Tax=Onchocerca ochengi TaxID=42157 RepID=A0A182E379_ONCOC|nr:unnamed protein product [Onchocerca ochengi]